MNGKIPYTDKMLATIFRRKETTVQMALKTFEQFGMVELIDDVITIPNWGKHQSADYMTDRRDYMRNYMSEYRSKQKLLVDCKTNSKPHVNLQEEEREEDIDKKENRDIYSDKPKKSSKPVKETYGEFQKVSLTVEEYEKLLNALGDQTQSYIDRLDGYIASKGVKYKSHYATILNWWRKDGTQGKTQENGLPNYSDPDRYKNAESEDNPFG